MLALYLAACHTPEAATTVFKCSWGWTQKASETCRLLLQLLINILPSCITLVLSIYYMEVEGSYIIFILMCQTYTTSHTKVCYHNLASYTHCFAFCINLQYQPSLLVVSRSYGSEYEECLLGAREDWWEKRDWWKKTGMTEATGGR